MKIKTKTFIRRSIQQFKCSCKLANCQLKLQCLKLV